MLIHELVSTDLLQAAIFTRFNYLLELFKECDDEDAGPYCVGNQLVYRCDQPGVECIHSFACLCCTGQLIIVSDLFIC